jgi:membrane-associated phospholipid phosphatase
VQRSKLALAAAILAAALTHGAGAQPADGAGSAAEEPGSAQVPSLRDDIKALATEPLRWQRREWLRFGGVAAAVALAYQYDDRVRAQFANDGEPNYHEVADSMPAAFVFGGMWFAAKLAHSEEARWEAGAMRRAVVLETLTVEVLKVAFRRERPGPGVPRDHWNDGGLSFPSGHTAAAFAVGTVLAESGDDRLRWLRRVIGYGIGVGTAYQRVNHDAHWLSDTVAGAAIGMAVARFAMKRRDRGATRGEFSLTPMDGGTMLTYTVPIRR